MLTRGIKEYKNNIRGNLGATVAAPDGFKPQVGVHRGAVSSYPTPLSNAINNWCGAGILSGLDFVSWGLREVGGTGIQSV